jgi:hypothetical protein
MKLKLLFLLVVGLGLTTISGNAGEKKIIPAPKDPAAAGIGLYARIDNITKDGFTSAQYRAGNLALHTWKHGNIVVTGVDPNKLVNGEYWHGRVLDQGVVKGNREGEQKRLYLSVFDFARPSPSK